MKFEKPVYIVDGARTPFVKFQGKPNAWSAADLAVRAAQMVLLKNHLSPELIDEVIAGCVIPAADEANIARIIALRLGCPDTVPGWTVQRNCASGLQALDCAAQDIASNRYQMVLAGGTEAMSRAPLLYDIEMVKWLAEFRQARSFTDRLKILTKLRPSYLRPVVALLKGLTDPVVNLNMGQTAENLAYDFGITREKMDRFSLDSHLKATKALKEGYLDEVVPLMDYANGLIAEDNGVRPQSSMDALSKLKPVFDKPFGAVTAGNSSQVSDGAAFLLLASEEAVKHHRLPVLGKIKAISWAALDPAVMGLGPVYAIQKLLKEQKLSFDSIAYWEINEAFATQVLACLAKEPNIPIDRLNVDGGAIAIGHPVGATGARLVLHLLQVLKRNQAKLGIASLCIGGGQGGAVLLENVEHH